MKNHIRTLAFVSLSSILAFASTAHAQDPTISSGGGGGGAAIGVGAEGFLLGPQGGVFVWDPGQFHIDGILAFSSGGGTTVQLGGRFYYVVHRGQSSDFSLGGGLGFINSDPDQANADSTTNFYIEAGAKIRAFVTSNVALQGTVGLGMALLDGPGDDFFGLGGRQSGNRTDGGVLGSALPVASWGLVYYFR